ncbi:hypothetical protein ACOMHN_047600 [Nucella lapillus]
MRKEGIRLADHRLLWIALICLGQCVPCVRQEVLLQLPRDRTTKHPSAKAILHNRRSAKFKMPTQKPTISTKYPENAQNTSKTKGFSITERTIPTTERLTEISESDINLFGTSKPRHPRSTMDGRSSRVFVDSAFSDYALLWITKPDAAARKAEVDRKEAGDRGGDPIIHPAYTWTPAFSPPSRPAPSTSNRQGDDDASAAFPTRSPRERTDSCCSSQSLQLDSPQEVTDEKPVSRTAKQNYSGFPEEKVLYIGGIFELSQNSHAESARSELDAALLAIRHVNDKQVVPGYRLQLVFNDSKIDNSQQSSALRIFAGSRRQLRLNAARMCSHAKNGS